MQKAKLRLLPNDRAIIELPENISPDQMKQYQEAFQEGWESRDPIFLSQFEVIDQRQPSIESRLAAIEAWIETQERHEALSKLTRASEDLEGGYQ